MGWAYQDTGLKFRCFLMVRGFLSWQGFGSSNSFLIEAKYLLRALGQQLADTLQHRAFFHNGTDLDADAIF